jgi:hypothetical protein
MILVIVLLGVSLAAFGIFVFLLGVEIGEYRERRRNDHKMDRMIEEQRKRDHDVR